MRLDKYLKVSRLIKRRSLAKEASDAERILVNGVVAKPSKELKVGDTYTDQGVIVLDNLSDATNKAHVEITITNSKNETVNLVDTSSKDTFKIKYTVVYKNSLYVKTRTVIVK